MRRVVAGSTLVLCAVAALQAEPITPRPLPDGMSVQVLHYQLSPDGSLTPVSGGPRIGPTTIYSDTSTSGFFTPPSGAGFGGQGVANSDDLHTVGAAGDLVNGFTFSYAQLATASFTATVAFYDNTDDLGANPNTGAPLLASFQVGPLPAGAAIVTIDLMGGLEFPLASDSVWAQTTFPAAYAGNIGPLITGNPGGNVGFSDDLFEEGGGLFFFGGNPYADFVYEMFTPEPGALALMAIGAVLVLRRR